jgi:hypothetical protein
MIRFSFIKSGVIVEHPGASRINEKIVINTFLYFWGSCNRFITRAALNHLRTIIFLQITLQNKTQ